MGGPAQQGIADGRSKELDADVILCAQTLALGIATSELVVATTNVGHLARIVSAAEWRTI